MRRLLIACGGTGGHLFPALAIAEHFLGRRPGSAHESSSGRELLFVGVGDRVFQSTLERLGHRYAVISSGALHGSGWGGRIRGLLRMGRGLSEARSVLKSFQPDAVLGMGGYTQVPALLAARMAGIPSALHEQNAIAGRANLFLARVVQRVLVSVQRSTGQFPSGKAVWTGLPVRSEFFSPSADDDHEGFNVLVLGGSQGAYFLNRLVADTLSALESVRDRLRFAHQTGEGDHPWVDEAYRRGGFRAEVRPFFHDVHRVLRRADLVVSRAGASSLAELAAVGRGAVLVPYPFAVKDHQYANAMAFQAEGAAFVFRQEEIQSNRLATLIHGLIASPEKAREMGRRAQRLSRPDAAARVCEELERIAGRAA